MKKLVELNMFQKELIAEWEKKDPIANYEKFLLDSKILSLIDIEKIKKEISKRY